jgi:hypothetical protein
MYVQEYGTMIHIVSGQLVCRMRVVGNCYKLAIVIAPKEEYKNDTNILDFKLSPCSECCMLFSG